MNTDYRIDDFQETYFVLESFDALRAESFQDFRPIFRAAVGATPLVPGHVGKDDNVLHLGTQDYARSKLRAAS
jgi:phenylalanine-4-hydroxylase